MKLKHFFIINAITAFAYALGELFVPETMMSLYGVTDSTAGLLLMARFFGWGLLAVGMITALAANTPPSEARQAIVKGLFIADVVGFIVSLMGTLNGTFNELGWSAVAIYFILVVGYGYFWFVKPEKA